MFPIRYFPNDYFAPRYWPKVGADPTDPDGRAVYVRGEVAGTISVLGSVVGRAYVRGEVAGAVSVEGES